MSAPHLEVFRPLGSSQNSSVAPHARPTLVLPCPGQFRSNLVLLNCKYTTQARFDQLITTGFTDEAMLQSLFSAGVSTALKSPSEWPRTTKYYWYRAGSAYSGAMARASAEFIVGSLLRDDPRHLTCADDDNPLFRQFRSASGTYSCDTVQRIMHALYDSVTVRRSELGRLYERTDLDYTAGDEDKIKRLPAFSRLAGVLAGALAQYPWQPQAENSLGAISQRAGLSFLTTFLGSFYNEFGLPIPGLRAKPLLSDQNETRSH